MDQWPHMAIHPPNYWKLSQATIRFFTEVLHVKPLLTLDDWTQICQVFSEKGDGSHRCFPGANLKKSQQLRLEGSCEYPTIQFRQVWDVVFFTDIRSSLHHQQQQWHCHGEHINHSGSTGHRNLQRKGQHCGIGSTWTWEVMGEKPFSADFFWQKFGPFGSEVSNHRKLDLYRIFLNPILHGVRVRVISSKFCDVQI